VRPSSAGGDRCRRVLVRNVRPGGMNSARRVLLILLRTAFNRDGVLETIPSFQCVDGGETHNPVHLGKGQHWCCAAGSDPLLF
jgi:hypothetical protein